MEILNELLRIVENATLSSMKSNSRLKFKKDPAIYYFKNWEKPNSKDWMFVTLNGQQTYKKKTSNLTHIDTKAILSEITNRSIMREVYILKEEEEDPKIELLPREKLLPLLEKLKGKIFTVAFIKKDGSKRIMNCRLGVKRHLRGGELPYDPLAKGLLPVYDLQKNAYRMINLMTIYNLKIEGRNFIVK